MMQAAQYRPGFDSVTDEELMPVAAGARSSAWHNPNTPDGSFQRVFRGGHSLLELGLVFSERALRNGDGAISDKPNPRV